MDISVKATGATQVEKLAVALEHLKSVSLSGLTSKINSLEKMMQPFKNMDAAKGINKFANSLNKLAGANLSNLAGNIQNMATALRPLTNEMIRGAGAAQSYATVIQKMSAKTITSGNAMKKASGSFNIFSGAWQKMIIGFYAASKVKQIMSGWVTEANAYIENLNLFTVAMGEYTEQAVAYANQVGDKLGIDPSQWMRQQGIIMDMSRSFGVTTDTAYKMSRALTQIAYDFSSLYNLDIDTALKKVQSGLAGEIEPLRRIGKDLSVARLQMEATKLGLTENVSKMTQANKAMLRTIALLKQSGSAMGDLARTINSPANQLRIFNAQVVQMKRALGYILLPALQMILPYLIAIAKVIRLVAEAIATLFGFEMPKFNYDSLAGNLSMGASDSADIADNMNSAAKSAKKINSYRAGFDELNVVGATADATGGSGGTGTGVGGGSSILEAELERMADLYDKQFLANVDDKISRIVGHMIEWLGLGKAYHLQTGETEIVMTHILTWADFFKTRLGEIIIAVGTIGTIMAGWKIASSVYTFFNSPMVQSLMGVGSAASAKVAEAGGITAVVKGLPAQLSKVLPMILPIAGIIAIIALISVAIYQLWKDNEEFRDAVTTMWTGIKDTFMGIWNNFLKPTLLLLIGFIQAVWKTALKPVWDSFKDMVAAIVILIANLWKLIKPIFDGLVEVLGEVVKGLGELIAPVLLALLKGFGKILVGIFDGITDAINIVIGVVKTVIGWFKQLVDWIDKVFGDGNKKLTIDVNGSENIGGTKPITRFATGGFPEDGLFMANSTELVGGFSGGRSAVVNNGQIIDGVASGVYDAVYRAMSDASGNKGEADIVVAIDGEAVFRANRKASTKKGQPILQTEYAR